MSNDKKSGIETLPAAMVTRYSVSCKQSWRPRQTVYLGFHGTIINEYSKPKPAARTHLHLHLRHSRSVTSEADLDVSGRPVGAAYHILTRRGLPSAGMPGRLRCGTVAWNRRAR